MLKPCLRDVEQPRSISGDRKKTVDMVLMLTDNLLVVQAAGEDGETDDQLTHPQPDVFRYSLTFPLFQISL